MAVSLSRTGAAGDEFSPVKLSESFKRSGGAIRRFGRGRRFRSDRKAVARPDSSQARGHSTWGPLNGSLCSSSMRIPVESMKSTPRRSTTIRPLCRLSSLITVGVVARSMSPMTVTTLAEHLVDPGRQRSCCGARAGLWTCLLQAGRAEGETEMHALRHPYASMLLDGGCPSGRFPRTRRGALLMLRSVPLLNLGATAEDAERENPGSESRIGV